MLLLTLLAAIKNRLAPFAFPHLLRTKNPTKRTNKRKHMVPRKTADDAHHDAVETRIVNQADDAARSGDHIAWLGKFTGFHLQKNMILSWQSTK